MISLRGRRGGDSQSTGTRLMTRARDAGLAPEVRIQEPRRAPAVDPTTRAGRTTLRRPTSGRLGLGVRRSGDDPALVVWRLPFDFPAECG